MKTVLIDNEDVIIRGLKQMIALYCPEIQLLGEANSVYDGVQLIRQTQPDLVILDIEMDDGTGLDLLRQLSNRTFQLIFITAHDQYALEAFRFSAIDFLLKPIDPEDLLKAIQKAKDQQEMQHIHLRLSALMDNMQQLSSGQKKIILRDAESIHLLQVQEIIRCEAEGSYTRFFLTDGRKILVSKNLKSYEHLLSSHGFFRPHHSHLINIQQIVRFDKSEGGMLIMQDKSSLPVSGRKRPQLLHLLAKL